MLDKNLVDHRGSIARYLDDKATRLTTNGQKHDAVILAAAATDIRAELDLRFDAELERDFQSLVAAAADIFQLARREIVSRDVTQRVCRARNAVMHVAKYALLMSNKHIAESLGRSERNTVRHGLVRAAARCDDVPEYAAQVAGLMTMFKLKDS